LLKVNFKCIAFNLKAFFIHCNVQKSNRFMRLDCLCLQNKAIFTIPLLADSAQLSDNSAPYLRMIENA